MASLNSELALVKRFHVLCKNYENRPLVARHNTLPSLVRFLGSNDRETRQYSLAALYLLAQHPENVELLSWESALVKGIFKVYKNTEYDDPELHDLTNKILDCLAPALQNQDPRKVEAPAADVGSSSNKNQPENSISDRSPVARRAHASRVLRGVGSDAIHTVILEIPALNPRRVDDISAIEDIFHSTRGVLSYSIFVENKRVQLFLTCKISVLQQILLESGFESIVIQDEVVGQDIFSGSGGGHSSNSRSCYDGEGPPRRPSYLGSITNGIYKTALVLRGGGNDDDTLSSRVQQQRAREQQGSSTMDYVVKALAKWW